MLTTRDAYKYAQLNSDPLRNTRTYVSKAVHAAQGEMECKQDFFEAVDLVVLGNGREVFMVNSPRRVPLSACIVVHGNADVNNSPWNDYVNESHYKARELPPMCACSNSSLFGRVRAVPLNTFPNTHRMRQPALGSSIGLRGGGGGGEQVKDGGTDRVVAYASCSLSIDNK